MAPEARARYLAAVEEEYKTISVKQAVEYLTGRPIFVGDDKTGYTVQWDKRTKLVHLFPGHQPDGMGVETFVAMSFSTDETGDPLRNADGTIMKPVFVNAATQENLTRSILKIFAGGLPAALNGAVAAGITADVQKDCQKKGNCGGGSQPVILNQAIAGSTSTAGSAIDATLGTGACGRGGGCR